MKLVVFTSNQRRHLTFLDRLKKAQHDVTAIIECVHNQDGTGYHKSYTSPVMREYFKRVRLAEEETFSTTYCTVPCIPLAMGDGSKVPLKSIMLADQIIVFGASWLKDPLCDDLIARKAVNIHMGIAPEYRGSSCNFWAMHDKRPDLVGATIHMLAKGLDDGDVLFRTDPMAMIVPENPWLFTMQAVDVAQRAVLRWLDQGAPKDSTPQDSSRQIRYTKGTDFTDEIAQAFMDEYDAKS